ncbi:hypothetical protein Tco_1293882 [Tanacetum coccineum]
MSSPDHPTANLEDAFSSNFPNYVPTASPDYILTSPRKTYSTSTSESLAMTQDAIRKLVADSVTTALEAQAVTCK